eukprot:6657489-Pyramimonas_sp.AAC.2
MDYQQYKFWSCSIHIDYASAVAFRNASGQKAANGQFIQYVMQERVHGTSSKVMSVCMAPDLREPAQKHKWSEHRYYQRGVHSPV